MTEKILYQVKTLLIDQGYIVKDGSNDNLIIALLIYGSHVYDSLHEASDYDYLAVVDSKLLKKPLDILNYHHNSDDIEFSIYSNDSFKNLLDNASIHMVESIFTPDEFILHGKDWLVMMRNDFQDKLNNVKTRSEYLNKIRSSFSQKSANSEVKARKKIIDGEIMIGLKSIFHSIRLLQFGIQLGIYGEIRDFKSGADVWKAISESFIPRIEGNKPISTIEIKEFYKKWSKIPYYLSEELVPNDAICLSTRFKMLLPKM